MDPEHLKNSVVPISEQLAGIYGDYGSGSAFQTYVRYIKNGTYVDTFENTGYAGSTGSATSGKWELQVRAITECFSV